MSRLDWIIHWLSQPGNVEASAVSQPFMEAYHTQFPQYRMTEKCWGAQPVAQAMRDLRVLYSQGKVVRRRIGLGLTWSPGYPRWVFSYSLQ